jgi:hypothetical protein
MLLQNNLSKWFLIPILTLSLSGCASLSLFGGGSKPLEVVKKVEERTKLNIKEPEPLDLNSPKWIIVTPENSSEVWPRVKEENEDVVLFALTDQGYETLAIMIAELRNFINTQRIIIQQYKQYYENQDKPLDSKNNK